MCGRYAFSHSPADLQSLFGVVNPEDFPETPRHNIAPTQQVPIVYRNGADSRRAGTARWGLIPGWVKDPRDWRAATFNARSEDAAAKPTFRQAFRRGRILVPASGFYEWKRVGGEKKPYYVRSRHGSPLAFAGLMDVWHDRKSGDELCSCSILTMPAAGLMTDLHTRMPLVLRADLMEGWLVSDEPQELLREATTAVPLEELEAFEVNAQVNDARNDDPCFVLPISSQRN